MTTKYKKYRIAIINEKNMDEKHFYLKEYESCYWKMLSSFVL